MAPKIEDPIQKVGNEDVTFISVATVDRDDEGKPQGKDDCFCGCGEEPTGKKALYKPGHDQRALGYLTRAQRAGRKVVFTPHSETEKLTPIAAAGHMFHEKMVTKAQDALTKEPAPAKEKEEATASE